MLRSSDSICWADSAPLVFAEQKDRSGSPWEISLVILFKGEGRPDNSEQKVGWGWVGHDPLLIILLGVQVSKIRGAHSHHLQTELSICLPSNPLLAQDSESSVINSTRNCANAADD